MNGILINEIEDIGIEIGSIRINPCSKILFGRVWSLCLSKYLSSIYSYIDIGIDDRDRFR